MNRIHVLDQETIDRIAAGEAVERPASVAKELIENAIDAGSTRITIELRNGGIGMLRVTDNGRGISKEDIQLKHLMDFRYYYQQCYVEVYVGKLNKEVMLVEEVHALFWSDLDHDFFDMSIYAGEGNIGHMIEQVNMYRNQIFL